MSGVTNLLPLYRALPTFTMSRSFSVSSSKLASSNYPPGPQARHFPIRTETMLPPGTYKDKVVLVTGGGTGLGKGMSLKFSQLGAKVAICSRRLPVLEEAAKEKRNEERLLKTEICFEAANTLARLLNQLQNLSKSKIENTVNCPPSEKFAILQRTKTIRDGGIAPQNI